MSQDYNVDFSEPAPQVSNVAHHPAALMIADLKKSGLTPDDMKTRVLSADIKAACNVHDGNDGYIIPYFTMEGKPAPFYRIKLYNGQPKYKQPKGTPSHIYFPLQFMELAMESSFVVLTEGEKKAALLAKMGFPAVAVGGVDSWRTRTLLLPDDTQLSKVTSGEKSFISAKVPQSSLDGETGFAQGFSELREFIHVNKKTLIICYDTDTEFGTRPEVQRAAAALGFEMRYYGIPTKHIRQLVLPKLPGADKTAIDDFLLATDADTLRELINGVLGRRSAFPRHPNMREFTAKFLEGGRLPRKMVQQLACGILADLDSRGARLRNKASGQLYYFDSLQRNLMKVDLMNKDSGAIHESTFGRLLYGEFGLSTPDHNVLEWLSTQYSAEEPIDPVVPQRVISKPVKDMPDIVRYQLNDGQYVQVSATEIEVYDNGAQGCLFEAGHVKEVEASDLFRELERQSRSDPLPWWTETISHASIAESFELKGADGKTYGIQHLLTLLYYISPWLYKWRGMQLPIELIVGEAGSGKSSMCELRLNILIGEPKLRNSPNDVRDFQASISNSGGLHVTDNVVLSDKTLRQRLSDELCRLVTEPDPHIEQRKMYTNNEIVQIPVTACFALTAISLPFPNTDLLQRSIILKLDKSVRKEYSFDSNWGSRQLAEKGGRIGWLAHHLLVLQKFFELTKTSWDHNYRAKHRLIHFEQSLRVMAKVFGWDDTWIPKYLDTVCNTAISESDWAMEGLNAFGRHWAATGNIDKEFSAIEIQAWIVGEPDYEACTQLNNVRSLGKYMQSHKAQIEQSCNIKASGMRGNRAVFKLKPRG